MGCVAFERGYRKKEDGKFDWGAITVRADANLKTPNLSNADEKRIEREGKESLGEGKKGCQGFRPAELTPLTMSFLPILALDIWYFFWRRRERRERGLILKIWRRLWWL